MNYASLDYGIKKICIGAKADMVQSASVGLLKSGGYADLFEGKLEIKIEAPSQTSHKRYCKPRGFSDQGYRQD